MNGMEGVGLDSIQFILVLMFGTLGIDLILMAAAFRRNNAIARALGLTLMACIITTGAYLASIVVHSIHLYAIL